MLLRTLKCMYLFELVFSFSSDICPGIELLYHIIVPFLVFWGSSILFPIVAAPVCIPINSVRGPLPHVLAAFAICGLFDGSSSLLLWADVSQLWSAFLWWTVMLSIFVICLLAICMSSLEECLFRSSRLGFILNLEAIGTSITVHGALPR